MFFILFADSGETMKKDIVKSKTSTKTLNFCIIVDVLLIICFIVTMIILYCQTGAIPDTLCTCFFATAGGELLCTMMITLFKLKYPKKKEEEDDNDYEHID